MINITDLKSSVVQVKECEHIGVNIQNNKNLDICIQNNKNLDVNIKECKYLTLRISEPKSNFIIILNGEEYSLSDDGKTLFKK